MTDLEIAQKNLEEYLQENPQLREYQAKLDRILKRCPDSESRMRVLQGMVQENLSKVNELLESLRDSLKS